MTTDITCTIARQHIQDLHNRPDSDTPMCLVLEGMIEAEPDHFTDGTSYEAVVHLGSCIACQSWHDDWLDVRSPERVAWRERRAKYCCTHMFHAVTDAESEVRFSFALFRSDPCWSINGQSVFAQFCPWCGQQLPQHAFEQAPFV